MELSPAMQSSELLPAVPKAAVSTPLIAPSRSTSEVDTEAKFAPVIERARMGDDDAFAELVHHYSPRLYGFIRSRGASEHDAEDLVQVTFIKAHGNIHRYDPRYKFVTWLFTIGARTAASFYRRHREHEPLTEQSSVTTVDPATRTAKADEVAVTWAVARRALPAAQHDVLWLRYAEDLSVRDIAKVVGKTAVHVKVLLHRGRRNLARELSLMQAPMTSGRKEE